MKYSKLKINRILKRFNYKILLILCCFLTVSLVMDAFWAKKFAEFYSVPLSKADIFIFALDTRFFPFAIAMMSCIAIANEINESFRVNVIIKHASKISVWIEQFVRALLLSIVSDVYMIFVLFVLSSSLSKINVNFTDENSIFKNSVFKEINQDPGLLLVILVSFLAILLTLITINLLVILSKWVFDNYIAGIIAVIIIAAGDLSFNFQESGAFKGILFARNYPEYNRWLNIPSMILEMSITLVYILLIVIVGYFAAKRREFFSANQK